MGETKQNAQETTEATATATEETPKDYILNADKDGPWVKFFKETALKVAFRSEKIKDENEKIIYLGKFFKSFVYVLANIEEESDTSTGAQLARKLLQISIHDVEANHIKKALAGLESKKKQLEKFEKEHPEKRAETQTAIKETLNSMISMRLQLEELDKKDL